MKKTIKLLMLSAICALLRRRAKDGRRVYPVYGYGSHGEH